MDELKSVKLYLSMIDNIKDEIQRLNNQFMPHSPSLEEKSGAAQSNDTKLLAMIQRKQQLENELENCQQMVNHITDKIMKLQDARETRILYLRYVKGDNVRKIARTMCYSKRACYYLLKAAVADYETMHNIAQ